VRALAPGRTVLHFATHGLFRDDDPLGSLLLLASDAAAGTPPPADRDGLWTAREIFSTPLAGTELVTLSACRSGVGRLSGDGVLGLARAFLVAGARSVVVSLWPVADPVASFQMTELYRDLLGGPLDRARALRRAQLATLAALREGRITTAGGRPLGEQPRYWAPFVLIGASR
jgi:CHAT domain-containing protein